MFWLAEVFNGRYTQEELERHERWARDQRAETVRHLFAAAGRGLVKAAGASARGVRTASTGLAAAYIRERRRRAAIRELQGLSDAILRDIGLSRGNIPLVVEDMLAGKPETRTALRVFTRRPRGGTPAAGSSGDGRDAANEWQRAA